MARIFLMWVQRMYLLLQGIILVTTLVMTIAPCRRGKVVLNSEFSIETASTMLEDEMFDSLSRQPSSLTEELLMRPYCLIFYIIQMGEVHFENYET